MTGIIIPNCSLEPLILQLSVGCEPTVIKDFSSTCAFINSELNASAYSFKELSVPNMSLTSFLEKKVI